MPAVFPLSGFRWAGPVPAGCPRGFMSETTLAQLQVDEQATVAALQGGGGLQHRLRSVGVKEGKGLRVVAKHHFDGPLVVEIDRRHITLGRGMAQKILVTRAP